MDDFDKKVANVASKGSVDILITLLSRDERPSNTPKKYEYALSEAAMNGDIERVQILLNVGATDSDGEALFWANNNRHDAVVKLLKE